MSCESVWTMCENCEAPLIEDGEFILKKDNMCFTYCENCYRYFRDEFYKPEEESDGENDCHIDGEWLENFKKIEKDLKEKDFKCGGCEDCEKTSDFEELNLCPNGHLNGAWGCDFCDCEGEDAGIGLDNLKEFLIEKDWIDYCPVRHKKEN